MVYVHDDAGRPHEDDLNVPDTPLERSIHTITVICSIAFVAVVCLHMFGGADGAFTLKLAMGTGGLFLLSLIAFFTTLMADKR
jgi:hypothetical protein